VTGTLDGKIVPPAALQNGTTTDPTDSSITEPASLLTPVWVAATGFRYGRLIQRGAHAGGR
jgi:hypothetical protein